MRRMNLIPSDLRMIPFLDTKKVFVSTILLTSVALLLLYLFQLPSIQKYRFLVANQKTEQRSLLEEEKKLEDILSQSDLIGSEDLRLKEKIGVIQAIVSDKVFWSPILKDMTHLVPKGSWLERFEITEKTEEGEDKNFTRKKIVFEGVSLDNQKSFEFLTNLERSKYFRSLVLVFNQKDEIGERTVYRFYIEGEVSG